MTTKTTRRSCKLTLEIARRWWWWEEEKPPLLVLVLLICWWNQEEKGSICSRRCPCSAAGGDGARMNEQSRPCFLAAGKAIICAIHTHTHKMQDRQSD